METASEFYFDEHVIKMTPEIIRKRLKGDIFKRITRKLKGKNLNDIVNKELTEINQRYDFYRDYFSLIREQKYCEMKYQVFSYGKHALYLKEGKGIEIFDINGAPKFEKDEQELKTNIPVRKEGEEFELVLFNQPQIEIPSFGRLNLHYSFNTEISLDYSGRDWEFTKDPLETCASEDFDRRKFFGEPGKLYFRFFDKLFEQMNTKLVQKGNCPYDNDEDNDKLNFSGKIYLGDALLYQGSLGIGGEFTAFPFCIRRDERNRNESERPRINKAAPVPASVEV